MYTLTQEQKDRIEYLLCDPNATQEEADQFFKAAVPPPIIDVTCFTREQVEQIRHIFYTLEGDKKDQYDAFARTLTYKQRFKLEKVWKALKAHLDLYVETNSAIFEYVDYVKKKYKKPACEEDGDTSEGVTEPEQEDEAAKAEKERKRKEIASSIFHFK